MSNKGKRTNSKLENTEPHERQGHGFDMRNTIDLFVAGTGAVGKTLLKKLRAANPDGLQFRLLGACNSRRALWEEHGFALNGGTLDWSDSRPTDWDLLSEKLTDSRRHNLIFVDATGSRQVARLYPKLLANGIHIVTPSKLANTFEQSFFDQLQTLADKHGSHFRYETTVGAGLPVISTVENIKSAGDSITEISGVVSGTMTYLFNQLEKGVPFSQAVADASEKGYAEPDPRDDLSGEDVARKFLTLARTIGLTLERRELQVESLIPESLHDVDRETFLDRLPAHDGEWNRRVQAARDRGETLRYVGRLKDGQVQVGLQSVTADSPLGQLQGTDNLIQIYSELYAHTPLIIQGPGAGKHVTAAGVLSDILNIANQLAN